MHRINPCSTREKERKKKKTQLSKNFHSIRSINYPNTQSNIFSTLDSIYPSPKNTITILKIIEKRSLEITKRRQRLLLTCDQALEIRRWYEIALGEELIKRFGEVDVARVSRWTVNDPTRAHLSLNNRGAYIFVRRARGRIPASKSRKRFRDPHLWHAVDEPSLQPSRVSTTASFFSSSPFSRWRELRDRRIFERTMDNELYRFDDGDDDVSIKGVNLMNGYIIG